MLTVNIKVSIIISMLLVSQLGFSSVESIEEALDYCATEKSWVAQKVLLHTIEDQENKQLDPDNITSTLLARYPLQKNELPITFFEWGQLYNQTTEISIPFIDKQKSPLIFIATSIISAEECSLAEPSYFEITPEKWIFSASE
ncbi:hypothetical protein [Xenorhabdus szentirmaii]|uniref:hypothetical protein n=1 Tax=Xenorhabdus szentirmaii TaxID=290112 RepID=UPI0019C04F4D|nr:hypothetical protein [Xenorhabdus sp. 38]MBD2780390.1 hypothetical protein [Xenorhabdus sp. 38]